jgi:hypothetical protein
MAKLTLRGFFRDTKLIWEMGLGGVLAFFLAEAAMHLQWIAANVTEDIRIILILAACYGLYWLRHFFRVAYGTVEILVALIAIFGAMGRARQIVDDPAANTLLLVQLAAGMYSSFVASTISRSRPLSQEAVRRLGHSGIW